MEKYIIFMEEKLNVINMQTLLKIMCINRLIPMTLKVTLYFFVPCYKD